MGKNAQISKTYNHLSTNTNPLKKIKPINVDVLNKLQPPTKNKQQIILPKIISKQQKNNLIIQQIPYSNVRSTSNNKYSQNGQTDTTNNYEKQKKQKQSSFSIINSDSRSASLPKKNIKLANQQTLHNQQTSQMKGRLLQSSNRGTINKQTLRPSERINKQGKKLIIGDQIQNVHQNEKIKELDNIMEQNIINNKQKELKIREIFQQFQKKEFNELQQAFNICAFKIIQKHIIICTAEIKKVLLDIIELVSERGMQYNDINLFFNDINSSGLLNQIIKMIKEKYEIEQNEYNEVNFSDTAVQLVNVYLMITNRQNEIDNEIIDLCISLLDRNISVIQNKFKSQLEEQYDVQELKYLSITIRTVGQFRIKDQNIQQAYDQFKIPDQIMKFIMERIIPLMHINCSKQLQCTFQISIHFTQHIQDFQSSIFEVISSISRRNSEFNIFLVEQHNIIPHITSIIIPFASSLLNNIKVEHLELQQQTSISPLIVSSSLNLLQKILFNSSDKCKSAADIPNLIQSLIKLFKYKISPHINQIEDETASDIRTYTRECLGWIQQWGDLSVQMQLTDSDYIRVMAESIGSGGGDGEQLNSNIQYDLFKISRFFTDCQNGRMFPRPTFPQQTELFKNLSEQTEQEGGIEEVDSQMISAGFDKFGRNLRLRAKCAKEAISNYFCDQSNFE